MKFKQGFKVYYERTNGEIVRGTIVKQTRNGATYIKCDEFCLGEEAGHIVAAPSNRVFERTFFGYSRRK